MIYKRGKHGHMDATINGVRYREALDTIDRREALALDKKRIGEIQQGRAASKSGKEFAAQTVRASGQAVSRRAEAARCRANCSVPEASLEAIGEILRREAAESL
jgi:hypothetical protein